MLNNDEKRSIGTIGLLKGLRWLPKTKQNIKRLKLACQQN
jgi:hypothetical protein